ncbi:hypothetical protein CICLE_v10023413mg [Citrus x clementina]|uniref:Uncharacterized protein n=1 Tax=Citrus clementina TaxID=85681 RepID=V4TV30_CITCL|nr:hypothetical protein CICLE_v10023413mg [Citrus x clementina]
METQSGSPASPHIHSTNLNSTPPLPQTPQAPCDLPLYRHCLTIPPSSLSTSTTCETTARHAFATLHHHAPLPSSCRRAFVIFETSNP